MAHLGAARPCRSLYLYWRYIHIQFLSGLQYKGWWVMLLQTTLVVITDPISTVFMFSRFGAIGPWTLERVLLIYAMAVTSFGMAEAVFRGFDSFPFTMVQNGCFAPAP